MFQSMYRIIKTHILYSLTFSENHAVCEIMWKNGEVPYRPQVTVRRIRFAWLLAKATDTHSE